MGFEKASVPREHEKAESKVFTDSKLNYSIKIPKILSRWTTISNSLNGPSFPYFTTPETQSESVTLAVFNQKKTACSPTITGTSKTQLISLESGSASWGRMDAWDGNGEEGWAFPQGWEEMPCKKEGIPPPNEVYVLCAEKNGKTVMVCINQMTDNPKQAKEIFETFRWTK